MGFLLDERPDQVEDFVQQIVAEPDGPTNDCLAVCLGILRQHDLTLANEWARRVLATNHRKLTRIVSLQFRFRNNTLPPTAAEIDLIKEFLVHYDAEVRHNGAAALRMVLAHDARLALDIARTVEVGEDESLANELCMFADVDCNGSPSAFNDEDYRVFLAKLEPIKHLRFHACRFLGEAAKQVPGDTIDFLLRRIDRAAGADWGFEPIPDEGLTQALKPLAERSEYQHLLRRVRDASIPGGPQQRFVAELYQALSLNHSEEGIAILGEWVDSGEREKIEAVATLLRGVRYDFAFEHLDFVARLLERADRHGPDCTDHVIECLHTSVVSAERRGVFGQVFPLDRALRDKARSAIKIHPPESGLHRLFGRMLQTAERNIEQVTMEIEEHEE